MASDIMHVLSDISTCPTCHVGAPRCQFVVNLLQCDTIAKGPPLLLEASTDLKTCASLPL